MLQSNKRLSIEQAVELCKSDNLIDLGQQAHNLRLAKADPSIVSYVVDRNINYSNICTAGCDFCAFYRKPDDPDAYTLSDDELLDKVEELIKVGGTQILLQGGLHPKLPFSYYCELLTKIKEKFTIDLHAFSAPEIHFFSLKFKMPVREILTQLKASGLDTIPGGGAEILNDRVRKKVSGGKCLTQDWLNVHEEAHNLGMRTTATMMLGHIETIEERVEHLDHIRTLQDRTGGFTAFIPWTFQASNTVMQDVPESGAVEYLKTLAISRLFLDNITNIQASFITQGKQVGQMALFFGANDMGGTMMEENVVAATGIHNCSNEQEIQKIIKDANFIPRKRNTLYQYLD